MLRRQLPSACRASVRYVSKVYSSADEAVKDIRDGSSVAVGGFGICGTPHHVIQALQKQGAKNLTVVSNVCGIDDWGPGILLQTRQVKRMIGSYIGGNKLYEKLYNDGELEVDFTPQGTLAEKLRCGGAGIPAFWTPTGYGTPVHEGGIPIRRPSKQHPIPILSSKKEARQFNGKWNILEESLRTDFALVKAWKADKHGNLLYRLTARNFNPVCAMAGKICIAEVEELVDHIDADQIHTPSCYVQRIVVKQYPKRIEKVKHSAPTTSVGDTQTPTKPSAAEQKKWSAKEKIVRRAALELRNGQYVNLGIGIPTQTPNFVPKDIKLYLQSENGLLGTGPYPKEGEEDADLINAGKETVSLIDGSAVVSSQASFAMIRGGHMNITMLGGMEVSERGDLANWIVPGVRVKGMGGAMDLVASGARVIVLMEHCTKKGESKVLKECDLPLTGKEVVNRLITELCVFDFINHSLVLVEVAPGVTVDHVRAKTQATFSVSPYLKEVQYSTTGTWQ